MTTETSALSGVASLELDPFSDSFLTNPYPAHEEMREAGPVFWLERYELWGVARYSEVTQVLVDHETYVSSRGVGISDFAKEKPWRPPSLLLEADPPHHTKARHVVSQILTPKLLRTLKEGFQERADELVARVAARGGEIDGVADLAEAYPLEVFPDFIGLPKEGRENLLPYGSMVFNTFGPRNSHFERAMERGAKAQGWIMEQCQPGAPARDGLGAKIHAAAAEAGYGAEDQAKLLRSFLSAGVDTTVHGIGNALECLARNPEQFAALREDPALARAAFEETVRFSSPVQTFFRTTSRDTELSGMAIPEGSKVLMFLAAANRDPRQWERPDEFDIRRKAAGHVGFGFGVHACLGQMLARLEGECFLSALARHVDTIELAGEPVQQLNNTLRGLDSLPLRLTAA
ncbi:cytochrome P450 [Arthrobacter crystallopoietes BAB-32]|uniref:Cytochrome P450 n=1 Tax=Arthrobacter crystallopoietes BAB-32 TaxID=1246476 RepID=N1V8N5_9MICC|nr:cytochrome P450 [Arthrobacter crystallopoietes]EMY34613.1 cytochrome P450 [Arthrobacter crystallopoietes BAB-32]